MLCPTSLGKRESDPWSLVPRNPFPPDPPRWWCLGRDEWGVVGAGSVVWDNANGDFIKRLDGTNRDYSDSDGVLGGNSEEWS